MSESLASPSYVVIGASDLAKSARFLGYFGFMSASSSTLSAAAATALYGLDQPVEVQELDVPGARQGRVRLVATPHPPRSAGPYDARPVAIDLYTRDIHRSLEIAEAAGAELGELVEYDLGPLEIKEVEVIGPDHLVVVFLQVNKLRPSVLDHDHDRLHSEVHSIVMSVRDAEAALPFWTGPSGLTTLIDAKIEGPIISRLMGLPRPNVPVRFILLCDEASNPARLELLEFFEDPGDELPNWPLAAGLQGPGFDVADLDRAQAVLTGADFGAVTLVEAGRAVSAVAPGGVRFELRELAG
ncbi:MAG: hypothetical protein AAF481_20140 [Acidobacteriota bacterium]